MSGDAEARTVVTFDSDRFNLTEEKDYFFNPGCYGDDLGEWLIQELRGAGWETIDKPGPEDFGWYVNYAKDGERYCAVIGNVEGESWFIAVERSCGLLGSMFGGRRRNIGRQGLEALHGILSSSPDLRNVQWFTWKQFRRGGAPEEGRPRP